MCSGDGNSSRFLGMLLQIGRKGNTLFQSRTGFVWCVFICGPVLFFLYIIRQNHYIYFWDYSGYWERSYTTMESLYAQPLQTLKDVYNSVLNDEYNQLLPLLIALPLKIFGYTFVRYTVINYVFYLVPVWFVLLCTVKKVAQCSGLDTGKKTLLPTVVILVELLTFSGFYVAIFRGYIDIACLLPASVAILLFVDYDPCTFHRKSWMRDAVLSINLLLTFLFRRYFAYFIVGYMAAWVCYALYRVATTPGKKQKEGAALAAAGHLLVIGGVAGTIMLIFFRKLLLHVLATDYAGQYAAYDAPLTEKIQNMLGSLGGVYFAIALVGIVLSLVFRRARKILLFLTVAIVVSAGMFFRVQNMGCHHVYIIAVSLFVMVSVTIWELAVLVKGHAKTVSVGVSVLVSVLCFLYGFFPFCRPALAPVSSWFVWAYTPLQRDDIPVLQDLAAYLNELSADQDRKIYTLASGTTLNNSILYCMDMPDRAPAVQNLLSTADVDLRDGFPLDFLRADIVVTTDPVELHLQEGTQEVVRYLAEQIMDPTSPVGRHFEQLDQTYTLDYGVRVLIFRKVSEFERSDLESLDAYYDARYPDQKEMFHDRILGE